MGSTRTIGDAAQSNLNGKSGRAAGAGSESGNPAAGSSRAKLARSVLRDVGAGKVARAGAIFPPAALVSRESRLEMHCVTSRA